MALLRHISGTTLGLIYSLAGRSLQFKSYMYSSKQKKKIFFPTSIKMRIEIILFCTKKVNKQCFTEAEDCVSVLQITDLEFFKLAKGPSEYISTSCDT
jgi:hypothetical protein